MSILDEIEKQRQDGRLSLLEPLGPRAHLVPMSHRRTLYVTRDLQNYFETPTRESMAIYADLNDFILGRDLNVALKLDHKNCRMARLDPARNDVWEIRIYERNPQWRLFGRFAHTDIFVALLGPVLRRDVIGSGFAKAVNQCLEAWRQLFGVNSPTIIGSNNIYDYISQNVHVIEYY